MAASWHYKKTEPFFSQGKDTTRPNFSREERSEIGILIREGLQNPLDARGEENSGPVRIAIRNLEPGDFDASYLNGIVNGQYRERLLAASGIELPIASESSVFVIEDFGTTGLLGDFENYDADGPEQNWNAFWHREGEGAKGKASNGGAGQGKATYFGHSSASLVLGLTVRSIDRQCLLMGRAAFLRDYKFRDGAKYYRSAYWTARQDVPYPETNPDALKKFCKAFGLQRDLDAPGLSLVVPFAKRFDKHEALSSVILDFYMPIAANRLAVSVGDVLINSETIDGIADRLLDDSDVVGVSSSFTKDYRAFARGIVENPATNVRLKSGWNKNRSIPEEAFPEGTAAVLREQIESGKRVSISLPLTLKLQNQQSVETSFDVFIEVPPTLGRNEEAFVRRDLLIGAESHVTAGTVVQKTRSLTWIQNRDLSEFLLAAEEPTHLKWNASLVRDKGAYQAAASDLALRSIRQAVPRLLVALLAGSDKKDFKSLARYFARPAQDPTKKPGDDGPGDKNKVQPPPPPPPPRKPFRIATDGTTIRVLPNGANGPGLSDLPMMAVLELAYEGLDQDPFNAYDPYDFDVSDAAAYPVSVKGLSVKSRSGNCVEIEILQPEFSLGIEGFDPNVRLRSRLKYDALGTNDTESQENIDA